MLGDANGAQAAFASPLPDTNAVAQGRAVHSVRSSGIAVTNTADGQWRPSSQLVTIGVTLPSPRVTPETSVVGSMRRSDHGTFAVGSTAVPGEFSDAVTLAGGLFIDGQWLTPVTLMLVLGGSILAMRLTPGQPSAGSLRAAGA